MIKLISRVKLNSCYLADGGLANGYRRQNIIVWDFAIYAAKIRFYMSSLNEIAKTGSVFLKSYIVLSKIWGNV